MEVPKEKWDGTVGFFPAEWPLPTCTIADEIAAAIAPHLEAGAGWDDAPSWAKYITTDADGEVVAWEYKPKKGIASWIEDQHGGQFETIRYSDLTWEKSLKKRP